MKRAVLSMLAFKLVWVAIVTSALLREPLLGAAAIAAFATYEIAVLKRHDILGLLLATMLVGFAIDNLYVLGGVMRFTTDSLLPAPIWMALLWVNFALILDTGLSWLHQRYALAAAIGAPSGAAAYYAGVKMGLIELTVATPVALALIAAVWAIALPALLLASEKRHLLQPSTGADGRGNSPSTQN